MSETNKRTLPHALSKVTLAAVDAVAARLVADTAAYEPNYAGTIDLPDLLEALARIAESRPYDGDDQLAARLVELAALALLWCESNDGLTALLDHLLSDPSDEGQAERA